MINKIHFIMTHPLFIVGGAMSLALVLILAGKVG